MVKKWFESGLASIYGRIFDFVVLGNYKVKLAKFELCSNVLIIECFRLRGSDKRQANKYEIVLCAGRNRGFDGVNIVRIGLSVDF